MLEGKHKTKNFWSKYHSPFVGSTYLRKKVVKEGVNSCWEGELKTFSQSVDRGQKGPPQIAKAEEKDDWTVATKYRH